MSHFRVDPDTGRFVEVRSGADLLVRPAGPEPQRFLTEDDCRQRIEKMKAEGRMPTFEQFHRVVEDVLDEIDAERGDEPRERITPRRVKRIQ